MNRQIIFNLAKKEFFGFINSPLAYVITIPFLILSIFIYLRTSLVAGEASLRSFFELLPWFLILLAPALSMRLINDEQRQGTIELLYAHPLSELEIVLGKFLGILAFFLGIMLFTLGLPASLFIFANPDPGIIFSQYIGGIFMAASFLSIGLTASTYIRNPIGSFLTAASVSFLLIIIGFDFITLMFPFPVNRILEEISIMPHVNNVSRGLLDIRDLLYFFTLLGLSLTLAIYKLSERKVKEDQKEKRKLQLALGLITGIGILLNIFMSFYPLRIDLTQQKIFTLSQGTKQTLNNLQDLVTITVFSSRSLPTPLQLTNKEINDLLVSYQRMGKKISINTLHPDIDQEAAMEARKLGIEEITFNKIGAGKFEIQTGFLGLAIKFGDKSETIPFIQDTSDLEYQLTRRIRKLTSDEQQVIGFYQNSFNRFQSLKQILETQYKIENLSVSDFQDKDKLDKLTTIVFIDDGEEESTASGMLKDYISKQGNLLVLSDGVSVNPQFLTATKSKSTVSEALKDLGITLNNDLVFDLELNETLTFGSANIRYLAPYPFWLKALPQDKEFPPSASIKSVTLGWPSSIKLEEKQDITYKKLLTASQFAGKQEDSFNISPQEANLSPDSSEENILLGVLARKDNSKIILIGDTDFASDEFLQNFSENLSFVTNTVDFLAAEKDVASISRKVSARAIFRFRSAIEPVIYQYGNLLLPPLAATIFAIFYLARRKRLTKRIYEK